MVFFDIDQTLIDHLAAERSAALALRMRHEEFRTATAEAFADRWHESAERHMNRYLGGEVSLQGQRRARIGELFGPAVSDEEADALFARYLADYEEGWALFPDVRPCLDDLDGRRLGIITNGGSGPQRSKLESAGILDRFEVFVASGDIGIAKPDRRIFEEARRMAGERASACFYVGDNPDTDVRAAAGAGFGAIWLNRSGERGEVDAPAIGSLAELKRMLTEMRRG